MDLHSLETGWLARRLRRVPAWLLPIGAVAFGVAPHLGRLADGVAKAHEYWYDAVGHLYLSWERFQSLTLRHGFFDFRWFFPYADTGTYNEPALTHAFESNRPFLLADIPPIVRSMTRSAGRLRHAGLPPLFSSNLHDVETGAFWRGVQTSVVLPMTGMLQGS